MIWKNGSRLWTCVSALGFATAVTGCASLTDPDSAGRTVEGLERAKYYVDASQPTATALAPLTGGASEVAVLAASTILAGLVAWNRDRLARARASAIAAIHNASTEGATSLVKDPAAQKTIREVTGE